VGKGHENGKLLKGNEIFATVNQKIT